MKLATLCYVKDKINDTTLMLHRVKKENDIHKDKWNGLGGKFELGETPEDCVIREVEEESGLKIRDPKLKGLLTFPSFDGIDDWYVFVFVAEDFSGDIIDSIEGDLHWIKNDELLKLPLWEGDQVFLDWFNKKSFFSAKFNYKEGKLIDHSVSFY
ncbi:MAG: NUDIX domain-containing protein [Ignavibacteriaceae bacterium]